MSERYECPYLGCARAFTSWQGYRQHASRQHGFTSNMESPVCPNHCCVFTTVDKEEMEAHWDMVQHETRIAITQENNHWGKLLFSGQPPTTTPYDGKGKPSRDERMLWDFVEACREMALATYDNSSTPLSDGWAEDERLWDILDAIQFGMDYNLSNSGVERMIKMMRDMSGGSSPRINALPLSWKTLVKEASLGVDTTSLETHSFKVPEGLPINFKEIPFILKSTKAIIQELLFDTALMKHGDFFFGYLEGKGKYNIIMSTHSMMAIVS